MRHNLADVLADDDNFSNVQEIRRAMQFLYFVLKDICCDDASASFGLELLAVNISA
jgi:hypothetical protein